MTKDPVDAIMHVMQQAFDPAYGEAWTRRQVADCLMLSNTHYQLAMPPERPLAETGREAFGAPSEAFGFALSRHVLDEEELLLIGVIPNRQRQGVGKQLLSALFDAARARGSRQMFLEMRDGNPAVQLYKGFGFEEIGRRRGYYRAATHGPIDAVTFAKSL